MGQEPLSAGDTCGGKRVRWCRCAGELGGGTQGAGKVGGVGAGSHQYLLSGLRESPQEPQALLLCPPLRREKGAAEETQQEEELTPQLVLRPDPLEAI